MPWAPSPLAPRRPYPKSIEAKSPAIDAGQRSGCWARKPPWTRRPPFALHHGLVPPAKGERGRTPPDLSPRRDRGNYEGGGMTSSAPPARFLQDSARRHLSSNLRPSKPLANSYLTAEANSPPGHRTGPYPLARCRVCRNCFRAARPTQFPRPTHIFDDALTPTFSPPYFDPAGWSMRGAKKTAHGDDARFRLGPRVPGGSRWPCQRRYLAQHFVAMDIPVPFPNPRPNPAQAADRPRGAHPRVSFFGEATGRDARRARQPSGT